MPPFPKEPKMAQPRTKSDSIESPFDTVTKLEVPAAVRDFAEKGVAQAKDAYVKFKVAADETSDLLEGAYSSTSKGVSALGQKALETARFNTNASFDHALSLLSVKTISDVIELNTAFLRKQGETVTQQIKEFGELAQKVSAEAAAPVKAQLEKTLKFPG